MKKTKIIGVLIFILIICLVIILTVIASITMLGNETNVNGIFNNSLNNSISNVTNNVENNVVNNSATNINSENINSTNTTNSVENTNSANLTNNIGNTSINNTDNNTNETQNSVNNELNINPNVKTFPFELQGITSDMEQYIKDVDELSENVKQYIYKYGLFDVTVAEVQKYEYQESTGRLGIIFKLNNPDENKLRVIINANGNIDISNYN